MIKNSEQRIYKNTMLKKRKADIVCVFICLLLAGSFAVFFHSQRISGDTVIVTVDGMLYGEYELNENQKIVVKTEFGKNIIKIKSGLAWMCDADCPDAYCVKHKKIQNEDESIICIPHKVVVTVKSKNENSDIDVIVR